MNSPLGSVCPEHINSQLPSRGGLQHHTPHPWPQSPEGSQELVQEQPCQWMPSHIGIPVLWGSGEMQLPREQQR